MPSLLGDLPHQSWPLFSPSSQFPTRESVELAWALAQVSCICIDFVYLFSLSTHLIPPCSSAPWALWVLHHFPRFHDISRSTQRPEGDPGHVSEETRAEVRADPWTFLDHRVSTLHTVSTPKLVNLLFNLIQQPLNKNWWSRRMRRALPYPPAPFRVTFWGDHTQPGSPCGAFSLQAARRAPSSCLFRPREGKHPRADCSIPCGHVSDPSHPYGNTEVPLLSSPQLPVPGAIYSHSRPCLNKALGRWPRSTCPCLN